MLIVCAAAACHGVQHLAKRKTCLLRVQVPGVVSVSVTLATNTALITYDPAVTGPRSCLEAVESAGFDASLANTGAHAACLCGLSAVQQEMTARPAACCCVQHLLCTYMRPNSATLPAQDREQLSRCAVRQAPL